VAYSVKNEDLPPYPIPYPSPMKGEMDRRVVYGNKDFVKEMTKIYKITEKIKRTVPFNFLDH
jgi:hypothetical protein